MCGVTKKYIIGLIILATIAGKPVIAFTQPTKIGSLEYLKKCNGYKEIILGSDFTNLRNYQVTFLNGNSGFDADSCFKYACNNLDTSKIANEPTVDLIAIKTYKNKIASIYIFFKKKYGDELLRNFTTAYGMFTEKPNDYSDHYNWITRSVTLSLKYDFNKDFGVAVFSSNTLEQQIALDKVKRQKREQLLSIAQN